MDFTFIDLSVFELHHRKLLYFLFLRLMKVFKYSYKIKIIDCKQKYLDTFR